MMILFILILFFFKAGEYFDVTQKPVKSDLIVCLGGGSSKRIQKSIDLYNEGYSEQNFLVLVGDSNFHKEYIIKNYPETNYIVSLPYNNTAKEIQFIKKYMSEHHYKSVIIVSEPPHSRRIKVLTDLLSVKDDDKFSYLFVGSDVSWWHRNKYYQSPRALKFVFSETLKIVYVYLNYGLMEKLGIALNESEYLTLKKRFEAFKLRVVGFFEKVINDW